MEGPLLSSRWEAGGRRHWGPGGVRIGEKRCREGRGPSKTPVPILSPKTPSTATPLGLWNPLLSHSSTDSHGGPEGAENSGVLESTQCSSLTLLGSRAGAWLCVAPSVLFVGLFQELVLVRGDPHHLMPRAERHVPSASAAELPLAHELPGQQVSETEQMASQVEAQHGQRPGGGSAVGVQGKAGWVKQREPYAHSQYLPLCLRGTLEGFLEEGFHHSPTRLHSGSIHC